MLLGNARDHSDNFKTFGTYGANWYHYAPVDTHLTVNVDSVLQVLAKPWFSRLWLLQEACLARENICHCGLRTFRLEDLLRSASWMWTKRTFLPLYNGTDQDFARVRLTFARAIIMLDVVDKDVGWYARAVREGWFRDKVDTSAMFSLLSHSVSFETTESVDHVFAMLGLWRHFSQNEPELPLLLHPDYAKDAVDVFRYATRFTLQEFESLALL